MQDIVYHYQALTSLTLPFFIFRHLEIVEEFFMKPIKEGRIGGSTSSNAFTHTDYVKVSEKEKNSSWVNISMN